MNVSIENNHLVVRVPLTPPTASASGKTFSVASSHGNKKTEVLVEGQPVVVGLNAYIKQRGPVVAHS